MGQRTWRLNAMHPQMTDQGGGVKTYMMHAYAMQV